MLDFRSITQSFFNNSSACKKVFGIGRFLFNLNALFICNSDHLIRGLLLVLQKQFFKFSRYGMCRLNSKSTSKKIFGFDDFKDFSVSNQILLDDKLDISFDFSIFFSIILVSLAI